jgi:hypothetical protein
MVLGSDRKPSISYYPKTCYVHLGPLQTSSAISTTRGSIPGPAEPLLPAFELRPPPRSARMERTSYESCQMVPKGCPIIDG